MEAKCIRVRASSVSQAMLSVKAIMIIAGEWNQSASLIFDRCPLCTL